MSGTKILNPQDQFGVDLARKNNLVTNKSFFHTFSKLPVNNSSTLTECGNKAGHTITLPDIWSNSLPLYIRVHNDTDVSGINFVANDILERFDDSNNSTTMIYDGDSWSQITITNNTVLGNKNSKEVIKAYKNQPLTLLTTQNNPVDSKNQALKLFVDGKALDSFVAPTDSLSKETQLFSDGFEAKIYANSTLITDGFFIDYYSGTVLIDYNNFKYNLEGLTISCYHYIGEKLNQTIEDYKDYDSVTRYLTEEEKRTGNIIINKATSLVTVLVNNINVFIPYSLTSDGIVLSLFNPNNGENFMSVYNGGLTKPITYTFLI